jgi:hypothetical protein
MHPQLDALDRKVVECPAGDEADHSRGQPASSCGGSQEVGDLGDVVVAEPQIDAADHLVADGIDDPEDGPGPFLSRTGCPVDVRLRLRVVGKVIVPAHPLSNVGLRVERPKGRYIGV